MTRTNVTQSCPYSPHSGPVGCLPAPNIFPLAKETFANGKMFWNYETVCLSFSRTGKTVQLTVRTVDDREIETVEEVMDMTPGTKAVLNVDPAHTSLYVGGIPPQAEVQEAAKSVQRFSGAIEGLMINDQPVGLWNFAKSQNIDGYVER